MNQKATDEILSQLQALRTEVNAVAERVGNIEVQERQEPWHQPGCQIGDWVAHMAQESSPGILYDEARAREGPCTCYSLDGGELCWTKGVIGALDEEQRALYCVEKQYKTGKLAERVGEFKRASEECKKVTQELADPEMRLRARIDCMATMLRERGVEIR